MYKLNSPDKLMKMTKRGHFDVAGSLIDEFALFAKQLFTTFVNLIGSV